MAKPLDATPQPNSPPAAADPLHDVFIKDLFSPVDNQKTTPKSFERRDDATGGLVGLIDLLGEKHSTTSKLPLKPHETNFKLPAQELSLGGLPLQDRVPRSRDVSPMTPAARRFDGMLDPKQKVGDGSVRRAMNAYKSPFGAKPVSYLDFESGTTPAQPPVLKLEPAPMPKLAEVPTTEDKKTEVQGDTAKGTRPQAKPGESTESKKKDGPTGEKPAEKVDGKPSETVEVKPTEKTDGKPSEKPEVKPTEKVDGKLAEKVDGKPAEKVEVRPAEKVDGKPAEKVEVKPDEKGVKPADKVEVKPDEKGVKPEETVEVKPAETVDEKPVEKSEVKPAGAAEDKPAEKKEDKPAEKAEDKPAEKVEEEPAVETAPPPRPVPVKGADGKGVYESTESGGWTFKPKYGQASSEHVDFPGQKITNVESQTDGSVKLTLDSGTIVRELPEGGRVHFADDAAFKANHPSGVAGKSRDIVWDGDKIKSFYSESLKATYHQVGENSWSTDPKAAADKGWKGTITYDGKGNFQQVTLDGAEKGDRYISRPNGIKETTHANGSFDMSIPYSDRTTASFKFKTGFEDGKNVLKQPEEVTILDPGGSETVWKRTGENEYTAGSTKWKAEIEVTRDGTYTFKDTETGERGVRYKNGIAERETPANKTTTVKEDGRLVKVKVGDDVFEVDYETNPDKNAKPSANEQAEAKRAPAPGKLLSPDNTGAERRLDSTDIASESTTKKALADAKAANIPVISLVTDKGNPNVQKALAYLSQQKLATTIDISKSNADEMMRKGLEPTQFNSLWSSKGANVNHESYMTSIAPSAIGADMKANPKVATPSNPEEFVQFLKDSGVNLSKPEDEKAVLSLLQGKSPRAVEAEKVSVRPSEYRHVNLNLKLTRGADGTWTDSAIDSSKPFTKPTAFEKDMYTHNDLDPIQKLRMKGNLTEFNNSTKFSADEKGNVLKHADRLLNGRKDSALDSKEKANLADQLFWHIANNMSNEQGFNGTCNVTTLRGIGLKEKPSVVAKLTADIANDGQLTTLDGSVIKPKMSSIKVRPGSPEENFPPKSPNRTALSKLWDVTTNNVFAQRATVDASGNACRKGAMSYEEVAPTSRTDTGARTILNDANGNEWVYSSTKQGKSTEPYDSPLAGYPSRMADVWHQVSGEKLTDKFIVNSNRWLDDKAKFKELVGDTVGSEKDLEKILLKPSGAKILQCNTGILEQRNKQQKALDEGKDPKTVALPAGGEHVILVTGYDQASKTCSVDNSWNTSYDVPNKAEAIAKGKDPAKTVFISLSDLYKMTETKTAGEAGTTYSWVRR